MTTRSLWLAVFLLGSVAFASACSDDLLSPAPVASVEVEPSEAEILVGATVELTAVVRAEDGQELTDREVTWSSSDETVAVVDTGGLVTGLAEGEATITATSEEVSGAAELTVTSPVVAVGNGGTILRSTDGGASWSSVASWTTSDLGGVWAEGSTVVAVGRQGTVLRSTDGGASWSSVSGTTSHLYGVSG